MNRGLFIKVNQCIYCGNEGPGLTDEHGIPLGLLPQGEPGLLLRNATCCSCAKMTSLLNVLYSSGFGSLPVLDGIAQLQKAQSPKELPTDYCAR